MPFRKHHASARLLVLLAAAVFAAHAKKAASDAPVETLALHTLRSHWLTLSASALGLFIAAGGGIGGGGILVPLFIMFLQLPPERAVALSNVTILGGSIANALVNLGRGHPLCHRPLIDYSIILMMEPPTILGALVGSFVNKFSPAWLTGLLLVALLSLTAFRTLRKALRVHAKENSHVDPETHPILSPGGQQGRRPRRRRLGDLKRQLSADGDLLTFASDSSFQQTLSSERLQLSLQGRDDHRRTMMAHVAMQHSALHEDGLPPELGDLLARDGRQVPFDKLGAICGLFLGVVALTLARGGSRGSLIFPSLECGSFEYWLCASATLPFVIGLFWVFRRWLIAENDLKLSCGYVFQEGDVQWTKRSTLVFPMLCSLAGLAAGMFGVGGGIVKGPLMLEPVRNKLRSPFATTSVSIGTYESYVPMQTGSRIGAGIGPQ